MLLNEYKNTNIDSLFDEMNMKNCYYSRHGNSSIGRAEASIYKYLKENLSDDYLVYHNFHYNSDNNIPHQIDFLIFNKKYGYIVLEAKSIISERDSDGIIPEEQVDIQRKDLIPIIDKVCNSRKYYQYIDFMVFYWNSHDLNDIEVEIYKNKRSKWNNKSFTYNDIVRCNINNFFEDYFKSHMRTQNSNGYNYLEESDNYHYEEVNDNFIKLCNVKYNNAEKIVYEELSIENRLTELQKKTFNHIIAQEDNIFFIDGDAGTGKTYLAMAVVSKYLQVNTQVYYILVTNKLIRFIEEKYYNISKNITFVKYYSKTDDNENINKIGFSDKNTIIIIDEAQDIPYSFVELIINKCKECEIKLIILFSKKQISFNNDSTAEDIKNKVYKVGGRKELLTENCRNSNDISNVLNAIWNSDEYKKYIDIDYVNSSVEAEEKILEYVEKLVDGGLYAKKISILTNCKDSDFFYGKVTLFRIIKEKFPEIDIDTINRNKGCENTVVIIYDNVGTLINKKVDLYIAISRAKVRYKYLSVK